MALALRLLLGMANTSLLLRRLQGREALDPTLAARVATHEYTSSDLDSKPDLNSFQRLCEQFTVIDA
jgi:hypothetical protein